MTPYADLLDLAGAAARAAGDVLLERFGGAATGVRTKSTATDLVSDADTAAEQAIVGTITAARPDDGWLAEEGSRGTSTSGITWVVDPLDGTVNYLFGIPVWCVSIAAGDRDGTVVAVVHDPIARATFTARRGGGAFLNGDPIRVRDGDDLSTALIGTGFAYDRAVRGRQAEVVGRVLREARDVRRAGSAALDLCSVACGRLDGFYEATLEPWDKAAGILLVEEAGGIVTPLADAGGGSPGVVAAAPGIHARLAALVEQQPRNFRRSAPLG